LSGARRAFRRQRHHHRLYARQRANGLLRALTDGLPFLYRTRIHGDREKHFAVSNHDVGKLAGRR
jgi:hypothetical protein